VCVYVCVCVCPVMRFHTVARIRWKLCGNLLRVTESCMGYLIFYVRACAYNWTDSWRHALDHRNLHGMLDFNVRACVCTLCAYMHARARMRAFAHCWTYTLQNWWKHSSIWATCFLHARLHVHTMHAPCACVQCTPLRVRIFLDRFSSKLVETFLGAQKLAWLT
jgi:hypothetical protein